MADDNNPRIQKELLPHLKHKDKILETYHLCCDARRKYLDFAKERINNPAALREFISTVTLLFDLIEEILFEYDEYKAVVKLMQEYGEDSSGRQLSYKEANKVFRALKQTIYRKKLTDLGIAMDDWEQDTIDM